MKSFIIVAITALMSLNFIGCTKKAPHSAYEVTKTSKVDTISSDVVEMVHKKSGATVVMIQNQDPATSFMVGFRTPPYDDTGLFHIFEHAVLEGSRLYPSKSNFFHLANSSVASFINAMTGPVYTLYPFVTRSPKDFDNLLSVYMDAVFFPNVLEDPRIIKREGWRYETNPETKTMAINGIVLSEMKGAFSSPYRSVWYQANKSLVPDTPFAYSSGGLPSKVATLTFEQIRDAHKKYYHPQNSVIYLYGKMDFKKALETIDKDFLSKFQATADYKRPEINLQKNFNYPSKIVESTYPGKPGAGKTFMAKGFIVGDHLSTTEENALSVLSTAFAENDTAPLKLRMLKEGLASSTFSMGLGGEENGMSFVFEGTDKANQEKIAKILDEEIDKVVKNGLDQELLNSILNKYEFSFKEKNSNGSHRGMQLGSIVLQNWIYQDEPLAEALDFVTQFKKLRRLLADQAFVKEFFKRYFQGNDKQRWVVLTPDADFSKKFNAGLEVQVQEALKEKSIEEFIKEDNEYKKWVAAKESDEILAKTPTLELTDIKADEVAIETVKEEQDGVTFLKYPQDTNGISYVNLFFDLSGVSKENLKNLEFFTSFIKRTDTENIPFQKLNKEINTYIGGVSFGVSAYQSVKTPETYKPMLRVSMTFLNENREKAMSLVQELMTKAQFTPVDRVGKLVKEMKTGMVSGISSRAPSLSMNAASKSFYPNLGAFIDETSGGLFEKYVLKTDIDANTLVPNMKNILTNIFNQGRLRIAAITASKTDLGTLVTDVTNMKKALPEKGSADQAWSFSNQKSYDGYAIPGEVQYVSQVASFKNEGMEYDGSMLVYSRYLNNNYMTPQLREQAGAYGGGSSFSRSGLFRMSTYRDPNLKRSLEIFGEAVDFMKKEAMSADKLKPAILGSLKPYYRDKSIAAKTGFMTNLFLTDQTWDDYIKTKKQILSTNPEKISTISGVLDRALKNSKKGVAGNPDKLKSEAQFLKNILSIQ